MSGYAFVVSITATYANVFLVGHSPMTITIQDEPEPPLLNFNIKVIACDWAESTEMLEINSKNKALKNKLIKQKEAIEKLTKEKIEQEDHITRVWFLDIL